LSDSEKVLLELCLGRHAHRAALLACDSRLSQRSAVKTEMRKDTRKDVEEDHHHDDAENKRVFGSVERREEVGNVGGVESVERERSDLGQKLIERKRNADTSEICQVRAVAVQDCAILPIWRCRGDTSIRAPAGAIPKLTEQLPRAVVLEESGIAHAEALHARTVAVAVIEIAAVPVFVNQLTRAVEHRIIRRRIRRRRS